MRNPVMPYAWGSRDGIAALQGRPPASAPEAELWMGAHPYAASGLDDCTLAERLDAMVETDPIGVLGAEVHARWAGRLPFMLKVLSAAEPLSLQVHPDAARAAAGFAAEEAAGIDRSASDRIFRDPYAKPELLVAVSDFDALIGFRAADDVAASLAELEIDSLRPTIERLRAGSAPGEEFVRLLRWPAEGRDGLVAGVEAAGSRSTATVAPWLPRLARRYPGDPAVAGVLFLNHVRLSPAQGVFVAPGQIHAYLRGIGVEALASSDNVVRAGLTVKHVAVEQLESMLDVHAARLPVVEPVRSTDAVENWPVPAPEFELLRVRLDGRRVELPVSGPAIVLCLAGAAEFAGDDRSLSLRQGESAFVAANCSALSVVGTGMLMCARPGPAA
jgi:mannose-6-phosphate isomerase